MRQARSTVNLTHPSLELLADPHRMYLISNDADRRLANQAFFARVEVTEEETLELQLAEPFTTIVSEAGRSCDCTQDDGGETAHPKESGSSAEVVNVVCSRKNIWVDPRRIELLTSCLQSRHSTN